LSGIFYSKTICDLETADCTPVPIWQPYHPGHVRNHDEHAVDMRWTQGGSRVILLTRITPIYLCPPFFHLCFFFFGQS